MNWCARVAANGNVTHVTNRDRHLASLIPDSSLSSTVSKLVPHHHRQRNSHTALLSLSNATPRSLYLTQKSRSASGAGLCSCAARLIESSQGSTPLAPQRAITAIMSGATAKAKKPPAKNAWRRAQKKQKRSVSHSSDVTMIIIAVVHRCQ